MHDKDQELHAEVERFMAWLVERILKWIEDHGSRENMPNLSWPSPMLLYTLEIYEVRWILPEETFEEYNSYVSRQGEPSLHGVQVRFGPGNVSS